MIKADEPTECGIMAIQRITKNALLVADGDGTKFWIPRSQICDESEINGDSSVDEEGELFLPEWLAIQKGLV